MKLIVYRRLICVLGWLDIIYQFVQFLLSTTLAIYLTGRLLHSENHEEYIAAYKKREEPFLWSVRTSRLKGLETRLSPEDSIRSMVYFRNCYCADSVLILIHMILALMLIRASKARKRPTLKILAAGWTIGNLLSLIAYSIWRIIDEFWITLTIALVLRSLSLALVILYLRNLTRRTTMTIPTIRISPVSPRSSTIVFSDQFSKSSLKTLKVKGPAEYDTASIEQLRQIELKL